MNLKNITFKTALNGGLLLILEERKFRVTAIQCFPYSNPRKFISIRDDDWNEILLIDDLDELDAHNREVICEVIFK